MKVLVCGDRNWNNYNVMYSILKDINPSLIIEGECKGADLMAKNIAKKLNIKVLSFKAEWNKYGKRAGPIRNMKMINEGNPDIVIAFHNNISKSKGTKDCLIKAKRKGIYTCLVEMYE